jgi:glucose-6-phosphate 1-dehydrogenase
MNEPDDGIKKADKCLLDPIADPFGIVIFGASGDLTKRKLIPSLFNLFINGLFPDEFFILGTARTGFSDNEYRSVISGAPGKIDHERWEEFSSHIYYHHVDYRDHKTFGLLFEKLRQLEMRYGCGKRRLFYLAVPPVIYEDIIDALGTTGFVSGDGWSRVVVEKPFGHDLASARALNNRLHKYFDEESIFRIDHYLGKETVQDILLFRFANSLFEPIWNRNHIDHIQITAAESLGVGARAGYYDRTGIIRDMFQNHIIQLLSLIAMEPPVLVDSERTRDEKVKVFRSLRYTEVESIPGNVVFGQYTSGFINGDPGSRIQGGGEC